MMADVKQREVRMTGRKKPGNKPRYHTRVHKQIRVEVFQAMQRRYKSGMDARVAVRLLSYRDLPRSETGMPEERWHESKKDRFESGGEGL